MTESSTLDTGYLIWILKFIDWFNIYIFQNLDGKSYTIQWRQTTLPLISINQ